MKAFNNFACNITHVPLPLRSEIFIHKKRNQVNTDKHVFLICKCSRGFLNVIRPEVISSPPLSLTPPTKKGTARANRTRSRGMLLKNYCNQGQLQWHILDHY